MGWLRHVDGVGLMEFSDDFQSNEEVDAHMQTPEFQEQVRAEHVARNEITQQFLKQTQQQLQPKTSPAPFKNPAFIDRIQKQAAEIKEEGDFLGSVSKYIDVVQMLTGGWIEATGEGLDIQSLED